MIMIMAIVMVIVIVSAATTKQIHKQTASTNATYVKA